MGNPARLNTFTTMPLDRLIRTHYALSILLALAAIAVLLVGAVLGVYWPVWLSLGLGVMAGACYSWAHDLEQAVREWRAAGRRGGAAAAVVDGEGAAVSDGYTIAKVVGRIELGAATKGATPPDLSALLTPCLRRVDAELLGLTDLTPPGVRAEQYRQLHEQAKAANARIGVQLSPEQKAETDAVAQRWIAGCFSGTDPFLAQERERLERFIGLAKDAD